MFSFAEFADLDLRDFEFWESTAKRVQAERQLERAESMRISQLASAEVFMEFVQNLRHLTMTPAELRAEVDNNWTLLKDRGRG